MPEHLFVDCRPLQTVWAVSALPHFSASAVLSYEITRGLTLLNLKINFSLRVFLKI